MRIADDIARTIDERGEPLKWRTKGSLVETDLVGLVQSPMSTTFVNDLEQTGFVIYIVPMDPAPVRYDSLFVRNRWRDVDEVQVEKLNNVPLSIVLRVLG